MNGRSGISRHMNLLNLIHRAKLRNSVNTTLRLIACSTLEEASSFVTTQNNLSVKDNCSVSAMGRVRTKTVKKAAKIIIEKYYARLTLDFDTNKRICEEIAISPTKPLRRKIAGFATHLMRRLRHSQVRGISIKLQEEERERRDNYVP